MLNRLLTALYRRWGIRTLSGKLLLPSLALILLSLLGTSAAFLGGTRLTRARLLEQQIKEESDHVVKTLNQRAEAVSNAGSLLASDPDLIDAVQQETDAALRTLNSRAVVVRDRFDLALVQVYDQHEGARTNLMLSDVAAPGAVASSLLDLAEAATPVARAVGDRLLLLQRFAISDGAGTVVVGIDLETELQRVLAQDHLTSHLQLIVRGVQVGTCLPGDFAAGAFEAGDGWVNDHYGQKRSLTLGSTPAELLLVRPTEDIERVTTTGLIVTIGGVLLTVLLLSGLNVMVIRSIGHPMESLSGAAKRVAQGELNARVRLNPHPLTIGAGDEIGLLAESFSEMTDDLQDLYANLEAKVEARTAELATAAEVARAVSSSLDLPAILRKSAGIIKTRLEAVCPGVYHVGIYLIEEGHGVAVLREAGSEADEHVNRASVRVPLGTKSPVALAASKRSPEVVQNVKLACAHLKPPLLLDTNSAAAAPLLIGDRLIGVLSVESKQPNAFSSNALQLLTTLADQIAIGVHNARLYEHQLRVAEHCVDLDRTKSQFLKAISHGFRAPLNTLTRLSEGLLERIDGRVTEAETEDLRVVHELGERLLVLVEDLVDISRVRAGALTLELSAVDVRRVVESAMGTAALLPEGRSTTVRADFDSIPSTIRADGRRLRQVILGLLSTAACIADDGRIEVRARTVEALNTDTDRLESFLEVTVAYTGDDVSQRELSSAFRAVGQPDLMAAGEEWGGTGPGLSLVRRLVELQGGRIWAEREPGGGATCTFTLPAYPSDGGEVQGSRELAMTGDVTEAASNG